MARVLDVQLPAPGPCLPGPPRARGQHAIHHVHAPLHRAHDIVGLAHPHQIARLVGRQASGGIVENAEHRLLPLAHGQPADGIAVETDGLQRLGAFLAQFAGDTALHDTEQRMPGPVAKGIARPLRPPHRHAHRGRHRLLISRQRRAFVETHDDIGSQQPLDFHAGFRRQHVFRAVDMAGEGHALFGQLAQTGQRHHLKAARIGQDRAVPVHETVQPAQTRDAFRAGPQHQVIGVAQQDVGPGRAHRFRQHRLDRRRRSHRHEGGRADGAARGVDPSRAGLAIGRIKRE